MKKKIIDTLDKELLYMSSSELNYYFTHGWSIYWIETRIDNVKCAVTQLYRSRIAYSMKILKPPWMPVQVELRSYQ